MARKKKGKGSKKKRRSVKKGPKEAPGSVSDAPPVPPSDEAPGEVSGGQAEDKPKSKPEKKPKRKSKKKPKRKPRKKTEEDSKAEASEPEAPPERAEEATAPPSLPDQAQASDEAEVVVLDDEPEAVDSDGEPELIDLDEEDDSEDAVAQLIAETVAGADVDEAPAEPEPAVIDLDAEVEDLVGDSETTVAEAPSGVSAESAPDAEVAEDTEQGRAPGDVSSPEARARLLAEALAHAEHRDARYRTPFEASTTARWKALLTVVLLSVAAMVAVAPPGWVSPEPPARLGPDGRADNLRIALLLQAEQVEAFRVRELRLPSTLAEVYAALPGIRYVRSGTRAYQLIAYERDGSAIVYDSSNPAPAFDDLRAHWRAPEPSP